MYLQLLDAILFYIIALQIAIIMNYNKLQAEELSRTTINVKLKYEIVNVYHCTLNQLYR